MNARVSIRILPWQAARADAQRVRETVFVVEQGVPPEIELDEWDERCDHALAYDAGGRVVGTGRLLPDGHIGRMAVLRAARRHGVGARLLEALVGRARARGITRVALNAQIHAEPFYARFGFVRASEPFIEAGIPHVAMTREI
jgi:predicted GNAT family N-acyltransferase